MVLESTSSSSPRVLESSLFLAFTAVPQVPLGLPQFTYSWEHHPGSAHLVSRRQSKLVLPNALELRLRTSASDDGSLQFLGPCCGSSAGLSCCPAFTATL